MSTRARKTAIRKQYRRQKPEIRLEVRGKPPERYTPGLPREIQDNFFILAVEKTRKNKVYYDLSQEVEYDLNTWGLK